MPEYESVIGLETHIQLNTKSKIFCGCKADSWEDLPNTNICPVCTGLPGVLPTLNNAVVEKAVILALAMNADSVQPISYFARKNYFYPDLPKGYQISQYNEPLAVGGHIDIPLPKGGIRRIQIEKLHIEEDAGKTVRDNGKRLIDFNRCGVPLVEMVTGPDFRSADEAAQYLIRLRQLLRWLGISNADMERGQLRCDANVSIRPVGSTDLHTKTEIKNVNSIENVRAAINVEVRRQIREVEAGRKIESWTLDWDETTETVRKMRSKESEADYRYFREPDLLPIQIEGGWIREIKKALPELPLARRARFVEQYELPEYDAEILTEEKSLSEYLESALSTFDGDPKVVSNWMINDLMRMIREKDILAGDLTIQPGQLAELIQMVETKEITGSTGKELLEKVQESGKNPKIIVETEDLGQVSDEVALRQIAKSVITQNPDQVATYKGGKSTVIGWFVGQIMRETKGKANAQLVQSILRELLDKA
ncbi:MAG: Asp-tRNA(Asn)/Glu-tRNA(Gln) amidotransferase subunit GatB [Anaerolineales bacterium]